MLYYNYIKFEEQYFYKFLLDMDIVSWIEGDYASFRICANNIPNEVKTLERYEDSIELVSKYILSPAIELYIKDNGKIKPMRVIREDNYEYFPSKCNKSTSFRFRLEIMPYVLSLFKPLEYNYKTLNRYDPIIKSYDIGSKFFIIPKEEFKNSIKYLYDSGFKYIFFEEDYQLMRHCINKSFEYHPQYTTLENK